MPSRFLLASFIALAPFAASAAPTLDPVYANAIESGIAGGRYQAVAVGLIENGERAERYFGAMMPGGAAPTATSAFEIGATSRTFTGLLYARALADGRVKRTDTIAHFMPAGFRCDDERLCAIPLDALAAHRAGLPAIPPNLFPHDADAPFADYDDDALRTYLTHGRLPGKNGVYAYSDLGLALLGRALAQAYRERYAVALVNDVLDPLGLHATGVASASAPVGYRDGRAAAHWRASAFVPAIGLQSTVGDLLTLIAAQLKPSDHPLRAAMLLARQPLSDAGAGQTALAWQVVYVRSGDTSWPLVWQAGVTGGFASFVGFRSDVQRGVVLLGNAGTDLSGLGLAMLSDQTTPPIPLPLFAIDPAKLARYEGLYRFESGGELVVRSDADGLRAQVGATFPARAVGYDDDAFRFVDRDAQLTFQIEASNVTGAVLHEAGAHLRAERLSQRAPALKRETTALAATELERYRGDFAIGPDLMARISASGDGLSAQLTARPAITLRRYADDRFVDESGSVELGFTRDANGRASALDWREGEFQIRGQRVDWSAP